MIEKFLCNFPLTWGIINFCDNLLIMMSIAAWKWIRNKLVGFEGLIVLTVTLFLYPATKGFDIKPLVLLTNRGTIQFDCWDIAGLENFAGQRDALYQLSKGQCAIIMFDATSRVTFKNVPVLRRDLVRTLGNIPIVLCGNKVDSEDLMAKAKSIGWAKRNNVQVLSPVNSLRNNHILRNEEAKKNSILSEK